EAHDDHDHEEVTGLDSDLTTLETTEAGEEIEIVTHVTSNDIDINDSDKVVFKVLKDDKKLDHINAACNENGKYKIDYTFDEAGTYEVISHVDAIGLHTMPKNEVVVE